jgi:hypothetical protein
VPFPHLETTSPEVSGVLLNGSAAASDWPVYYRHQKSRDEPDCASWDAASQTNAAGQFEFPRGRDFRFLFVIGDRGYRYEICTERDGERVLLWDNLAWGYVESPAELACNADQDVTDVNRNRGRCGVRWPRWDQ